MDAQPYTFQPASADFKHRPLPKYVDDTADEEPDKVVAAIPLGTEVSDGFRDVNFRVFARAIDRLAAQLCRDVGPTNEEVTITYLGPSDLRFPIFMIAAAKAGYISFWTSPRNSFIAHKSLMAATNSKYFLTPEVVPPGIGPVIAAMKMKHLRMPSLEDLLEESGHVERIPYTQSYEEVKMKPFTVIHTSGTTGIPKPIFLPMGTFCTPQIYGTVPEENGRACVFTWLTTQSKRFFLSFPFFHGAALYAFTCWSLYWGDAAILPPNRPLTAELANQIHCSGQVDASFLPPSILEDMAKEPSYCTGLENLKWLKYAGAALNPTAGEILKSQVRIVTVLGQTEAGMPYQLLMDPDDYLYICPGEHSGVEFQHRYDNLYELVVVRKPGLELWQSAFLTFPDLQELQSNDLWERHPDPAKSGFWRHRGRNDDIIVFDNGEKLNPVTMERAIEDHPQVQSAIIVGQGRFQSLLLVEPRNLELHSEREVASFVDKIWPTIEHANSECPSHGRLARNMIVVAKPDKPFPLTAKGGKTRKWAAQVYEEEINKAYRDAETTAMADDLTLSLDNDRNELKAQLTQLVTMATSLDSLGDDTNFFEMGVDSLQTLQLSRRLQSAFRGSPEIAKQIRPSLIYQNSTVNKLVDSITRLGENVPQGVGRHQNHGNHIELAIQESLQRLKLPRSEGMHSRKRILLTGSTGGLGSYLLSNLLSDADVIHVYCLNRSPDAQKRQEAMNKARGLAHTFKSSRVSFWQIDFSKPGLGLDESQFSTLISQVTHIIHNAWTVDFNRHLDSYLTSDLVGLTTLTEIALTSWFRASFYFISSIGTMMRWNEAGNQGPAPEQVSENPAVVEISGYGQSKYVAERFLKDVCSRTSLQANILRVGQIAGPVLSEKGRWNMKEWFPSIITSAKRLRILPNRLGAGNRIDWVPVDILSKTIVEILDTEPATAGRLNGFPAVKSSIKVYNLTNPRVAQWEHLHPVVKEMLDRAEPQPIKVVDYDTWLEALQEYSVKIRTEDDIHNNPAVKLLEFFEDFGRDSQKGSKPGFSTERSQQASITLSACGQVNSQWMRLWIEQWSREA